MNEDRAARYHRIKRRAAVLSLAWGAALLVGLLATGASGDLSNATGRAAAALGFTGPSAAVAFYAIGLTLLHESGALLLAFYSGYVVERRYGLSNERVAGWLWDQVKSIGLGAALAAAAATLLYAFIRRSPGGWWLPAGTVFTLLIVGLTNLAPVLLLPIFYRIKPIDREALRARLLALAERAGARVLGAYEWGLGDKTKRANAALTGLGRTRRILVSDTMLADYTDEEIEIVLAHELAHHVHGDIWKGIALESALIMAGFFVAARALETAAAPLALAGVADPAGLPLLLLAAGAVSVAMLPAAHAVSRAFERSADRYALQLTRNPGAFVSAMRRLAAQNLAEERPSRVVQWLFYSHPPFAERIAAARAFER